MNPRSCSGYSRPILPGVKNDVGQSGAPVQTLHDPHCFARTLYSRQLTMSTQQRYASGAFVAQISKSAGARVATTHQFLPGAFNTPRPLTTPPHSPNSIAH